MAAPRVQEVAPPNWWLSLPPSDLLLLLTGENLSEAKITVRYSRVQVQRIEARPNGHYVFVWLKISGGAQPGIVTLRVQTAAGSVSVPFLLLERPDPKGKFQGLSEDDVIYLIMPDRFADGDPANNQPAQSPGTYDRNRARAYHGGDLRGIRDHLPYLRDLGVSGLWLTPVYDNDNASPHDYHGYGAVDFYAVDEHLGTLQELRELVEAAHHSGIKIFLDIVVNHTGPRHRWAELPPDADWFHGTAKDHRASQADFERLAAPHATAREKRAVLEGWFADVLPDLNQENPRVAHYLLQNSIWWAEQAGADGFRLDTVPYVSRRFWARWHRELRRALPGFATIGEVSGDDAAVTSFFAGGRAQFDGIDSGLTTVLDYPLYFALRDVLVRGAPVKRLVDVLERDRLYPHPDRLVTFFGNHDVRRFRSEPGSSEKRLLLAYSLLLTLRGIPELYYGDEIGMQGGDDPDNRRDFPGGFPGDARNTFTAAGRAQQEQEIFSHVQALLRLRRDHVALRRGKQWHIAWDQTMYAFVRETRGERALVIFNNASEPRNVTLNFRDTPLAGSRSLEPLFSAAPACVRNDEAEIQMAPQSLAIYAVK